MKKTLIFLIFAFSCSLSFAQNVGIGTMSPQPSAALDLTSTNKGFLPPRLTRTQRDSISNPVAGLIIWCTDSIMPDEMQVYDGYIWLKFTLGPAFNQPSIGVPFGGGIIAYIFQPGDLGYVGGETHGLITTPINQSTYSAWGCYGIIIGAFGEMVGTGEENTNAIVSSCSEPEIAAQLCQDLTFGGFNDWFLPSKDELNKLYISRTLIGGFTNDFYSSSTEFSEFDAFVQSFENGSQFPIPKIIGISVRAIRYF